MVLSEKKTDYIAVFDSGVGGISVLRHLVQQLPRERFLYFGDAANAPYGRRTTEDVRALTLTALENLTTQHPVKAIVIACNTATAAAVDQVRLAYPQKIVIGIEPAIKLAADHFPIHRIGIMATEVTLREAKLDSLMHRLHADPTVAKISAPGLVELVEAGKADSPEADALLSRVLSPYVGKLDALVLGCTHYPFAANAISRVLGPEVELLDGGEGTARETRRRLEAEDLLAPQTAEGCVTIACSLPERIPLARHLLKK